MSGELRPGDRIPGELELVDTFNVSRMTVNKALSSLAAAGLLVRRRGAGTVVASPKSQESILEIHDIKVEVESSGRRYHHEVLERRLGRATDEQRARLPCDGRSRILALVIRHFADGRPFVLEDRLINTAVVPDALEARFDEIPPGSWLIQRIPWTEAAHTIRAVGASATVASLLNLPKNEACLMIERVTWQSRTPITSVRLTYPGALHELSARFSPTGTSMPSPRQRQQFRTRA